MRLLSIDPAGKSSPTHRGYAVIQAGLGPAGRRPTDLLGTFNGGLPDARAWQWGPLDLIVVEGQYPGPKAGKQSLITLGFGAGFLAGFAALGGIPVIVVPVYDWKDALIPGFANAAKAMYTANLAQMWPDVKNTHCLDAVGLGTTVARGCFPPEKLKKWTYK